MKMTFKKTLVALFSASVAASAASTFDNQKSLESKVDSINAQRGLELGGSIRAVAQKSSFDSDQDVGNLMKMPDVERNEFVTADIDFHFRPYENVRANATMRLGGGMQDYFAAATKTMSVPWINVEGNIGKSFYWIVGDFRQQYTPLTLNMPGVDVMYEPEVFARKRHMAQKEQMLEGEQRNLQGANVQFRASLGETVGELRAEAMLARLNRVSVLDLTGAEGNILPGDSIAGASLASNMDKWLVAANFELLPLSKNVYVGVTPMLIFDNEKTYSYTYRHSEYDLKTPYLREDINPWDTKKQNTMIVSGRAGADIAGIIGSKELVLDLVGEYAMSSNDVYKKEIKDYESISGSAILAQLNAGYKTSGFGAVLAVDVISNDSNWFNNAAQSSSFFAQRVLNSDIDGNTVKYGVYSPLYSTFDALYNFAPKFSPVSRNLGTQDADFAVGKGGQSKSYNIANYNKNSWTTNTYNASQLALLELLSDPALQMALPNGLATANRQGARALLTLSLNDWAEAQGLFSTFKQVSPLATFQAASFTEFGGGAKVNVFKALGFSLPLEISGSYKHSERSLDTDNWKKLYKIDDGTAELKSDFINAGLYWQYMPRLGFTAGFQMINTEYNEVQQQVSKKIMRSAMNARIVPVIKNSQMQWMVGLDYSVAKNAWLALNYGIVTVENEYNTTGNKPSYEDGALREINIPEYYAQTEGNFTNKFTQTVMEASINVEF